jgi:uncharacterized RDD family membrane protein YckC
MENGIYIPASFLARVKALVVDLFMIYMPILYIITYFVLGDKESFLSSDLAPLIAVSIYAIISTILITKNAQTPGKKAYEIFVLNNDNSKLSYLKSFIRFLLFLFSATILFGLLLPLVKRDKKALHDVILNTKVVTQQ